MGFKAPKKVYALDFAGVEHLDGLLVEVGGLSTGRLMEMMKLIGIADKSPEAASKLIDWFTEALISWNLEDDNDQPIKPTRDAVLEQDIGMTLSIIKAWVNAVSGVAEDLGKDSNSGPKFPVVNLPTELLSSSLPS